MKTIIMITIAIIVVSAWCLAMYKMVLKPTELFYKQSDILENEIKSENNKDKQITKLFELSKKSWHRTTGNRIRELGKMMEIKYNIKIFK